MKWHEEALKKDRVLARISRRGGKTMGAIKWARQAGDNVLYCVPAHGFINDIISVIQSMYPEDIHSVRKDPAQVRFHDGQVIHIAVPSERTRGRRMDAVVLDELSAMSEQQAFIAYTTAIHNNPMPKFFATYSTLYKKGGVKFLEKAEGVHHVTVDYLDLLEEGVFLAEFVRQVQGFIDAKQFKQEFGPYEQIKKKTNSMFKHLLSKK